MANIRINNELRIARAAARAEAAASKIEQILAMLEAKVQMSDVLDGEHNENIIRSERLEASEDAIVELAAMMADMEV